MEDEIRDDHIYGLGSDQPIRGISITFPRGLTEEDREAVWTAINLVGIARDFERKIREAA